MPKTRLITDYPYETYGRLLMTIARTKEAQTIPAATGALAASLRGDLYAFRRAVEGNRTRALSLGIDPELLARVKIKIVQEGVRIHHVEDQPGVRAIEALLGQMGATEPLAPTGSPGAQAEDSGVFDPDAIVARLKGLTDGKQD